MPGLSGFDCAREMLAVRPGLPILLTSGYMRPEDEEQAREIGIRAVSGKPTALEDLGRTLSDILAPRRLSHLHLTRAVAASCAAFTGFGMASAAATAGLAETRPCHSSETRSVGGIHDMRPARAGTAAPSRRPRYRLASKHRRRAVALSEAAAPVARRPRGSAGRHSSSCASCSPAARRSRHFSRCSSKRNARELRFELLRRQLLTRCRGS